MSINSSQGYVCDPCNSPCASCSISQDNCTACLGNLSLFLQNNVCVNASSCDTLTYADNTTNTCSPCSSPCLDCTSASSCTSCVNDTFLYNNSCVNSSFCPDGTVAGVDAVTNLSTCVSCDPSCLTCITTQTNCSSCNSTDSLFLSNNSCVVASSCPNSTYANSTSAVC